MLRDIAQVKALITVLKEDVALYESCEKALKEELTRTTAVSSRTGTVLNSDRAQVVELPAKLAPNLL